MSNLANKDKVLTVLELLITEIVYKAVYRVVGGVYSASVVAHLGEDLAKDITDLVVTQDKAKPNKYTFTSKTYTGFMNMCNIIDEIAKEIPIADKIEVEGTFTRSQRKAYLNEYASR